MDKDENSMKTQDTSKDQVLNIAKLNDAFMGDADIIKQILSAFQETVASFQEDFNKLDNHDSEQLIRLVHGLKGSSANIRAEKVAKQAAHLHVLIKQGQDHSREADELFVLLAELNDKINSI